MAIELSMPIGGVIPWIGDLFNIELPDNYMVIDEDVLKSLPDESPFKDKLNLLLSMEGRTFHMTTQENLQEHLGDEGSKDIALSKTHLPTTFTYGNGVGASYTLDNNTILSSGRVGSNLGAHSTGSSSRKYVAVSTWSIDDASSTISGDGYKKVYTTKGNAFYQNTYPHTHTIDLSHKHDISAKASYTKPTYTTNDSFGNLGISSAIKIPTAYTDMTHAKCKFIIRLW